jgi:hypothetical protein
MNEAMLNYKKNKWRRRFKKFCSYIGYVFLGL